MSWTLALVPSCKGRLVSGWCWMGSPHPALVFFAWCLHSLQGEGCLVVAELPAGLPCRCLATLAVAAETPRVSCAAHTFPVLMMRLCCWRFWRSRATPGACAWVRHLSWPDGGRLRKCSQASTVLLAFLCQPGRAAHRGALRPASVLTETSAII